MAMHKWFGLIGALALVMLAPAIARAQETEGGRNPLSILGDARVTLGYDNYLIVYGEGEVMAQPDEVLIAVNIQTRHTNIDTLLAWNQEKLRKFKALVSELGIASDDIRQEPLYLFPNDTRSDESGVGFSKGNFGGDTKELHQYFARRNLTVKLRKLDDFTTFLVRLYKLDLQLTSAPLFHLSNEQKYRDQARLAAIHNATEKATEMANVAGHKGIAVHGLDYLREWNSADSDHDADRSRDDSDVSAAYAYGDPRIPAGTIVLRATVRAHFEMK